MGTVGFHMAQQKEAAPSGIAGLVRYEEEKSRVNIKPDYVFAGIAAITEVELVIQGFYLIAAAFGILFGLMVFWLYRNNMISKPRPAKVQASSNIPAPQPQPQQPAQQSSAQ